MKSIWLITYNLLFLPLFWLIARIISPFNHKIKTGFRGRRELFNHLEAKIQTLDSSRKNILIHCSSLGEFEQAKPIIDELDKTNRYNFIVSFYSPSGFNHSKLDTALNSRIIKTYLPFDTKKNSQKFISIINPSAALFIKYDLWFNLLTILKNKNIFTALVNAVYDEKKFKWKFFLTRSYKKTVYMLLSFIASTDETDKNNYRKLLNGFVEIESVGDTKYERISKA
jgi:3-deoxy-D-manno-octulosonic-acid transferase